MALSLPGNPDLERFRRDARRLQRGVRDRDPEALALVERHHPSGAPDEVDGFALADAQLVLARSHGFTSWPRLRDYLRRSEGLRRDPTTIDDTELDDVADLDARGAVADGGAVRRLAQAVPALACLRYDGADDPARWARAAQLLQRHPDLPGRDLFVAATVADPASLRAHLEADPGAAVRSGGPFGWPPLLYLAYSRVPQRDPLASARLLLDAGADPDSGYLWQGVPPPFTVLTGLLGEGESGPGRQPRHPAWRDLALLLLERGADPNDRQALYNRMFGRDDSHLELLLEHGLGHPAGEVWAERLGVAAESLEEMMERQLHWAASHGFASRTELLATHGFTMTEVTTPAAIGVDDLRDGRTALHQAAFMGDLDAIRALLEAGADPTVTDAQHGTTAADWAQWARQEEAEQLLRDAEAERSSSARHTAYGSGDGRQG
ncbi:ankyrin repeat domain-containing protein [Humibacillus xanthopallidus]|uniref:ankyrin repeat domain-containing protein n=1 Tax=Humibacillus xanthopallidus TaxID=412689 RepID=UPI00384CCB1E